MHKKWQPIVPQSFKVPIFYKTKKFQISPLTIDDIDEDYKAVMGSVDYLKGTFDFLPEWPDKNMSKSEDLSNLGWHQTEFGMRTSFAYKVLNMSAKEYIGCVYIFPSNEEEFDVDVYTWVVENQSRFDIDLLNYIKSWIEDVWPFNKVRYPGR